MKVRRSCLIYRQKCLLTCGDPGLRALLEVLIQKERSVQRITTSEVISDLTDVMFTSRRRTRQNIPGNAAGSWLRKIRLRLYTTEEKTGHRQMSPAAEGSRLNVMHTEKGELDLVDDSAIIALFVGDITPARGGGAARA